MSRKELQTTLNEVVTELKRKNKYFRKNESDIKEHTLYLNWGSLQADIKTEILVKNLPLNDSIESIIELGIQRILESIYNKIPSNDPSISISIVNDTIAITTVKQSFISSSQSSQSWDKGSVFNYLKSLYSTEVRLLVSILNSYYLKEYKTDNALNPDKFLDASHRGESAINRQKLRRAKTKLRNTIAKLYRRGGLSRKELKLLLMGIDLSLSKADTLDITTIEMDLSSAFFNQLEGAELAKIKRNFLKDLAELSLSIDMVRQEGSDSRLTIEKKKIVKNFEEKIEKNKKVRVRTTNTEPKLSRKNPVTKNIPFKVKKSKNNFNEKPKLNIQKSAIETKPTLNLNALKAEINAKLSMTVIKNMGTPALENRTGRFARSVEVTDVIQTPKGFPSIVYTYQKGPYQTFEPGFAQGSTQRDPRVVISKSIREIAKELIVGRFYTRRT